MSTQRYIFTTYPSPIVRVNYTGEVSRFSLRGMQEFRPCARAGRADGMRPEQTSRPTPLRTVRDYPTSPGGPA